MNEIDFDEAIEKLREVDVFDFEEVLLLDDNVLKSCGYRDTPFFFGIMDDRRWERDNRN